MAVRGKVAAAILPEPRPDAFAVGLRNVQFIQRGARKKLKAAFAHRRREPLELRLQLEQKHEPVRLPLKTVFAHEAGKVEVGRRELLAEFLVRLARGADVGRFAEVGLKLAAARTPEAEVGLLGAFEQEDFVALVEAVKQRSNTIRIFIWNFHLSLSPKDRGDFIRQRHWRKFRLACSECRVKESVGFKRVLLRRNGGGNAREKKRGGN